jgi:glyoxylase-like metal-dependent hydrolase (beta-lactamase superfamily II)
MQRPALLVPPVLLAVMLMGTTAFGQVDLSGQWSASGHEDSAHRGGVQIGDYTGVPINAAGLMKAESWDENVISTHERQCIPHPVPYSFRGPGNFHVSTSIDPDTGAILAYQTVGTYGRPRTIWMDGRPHPSAYAPHAWNGFSTGRWEGNQLIVTTTHIKMGWLLRNGVPTSDRATMTEQFIRHGDHLLLVTYVNDPAFLDEPMIRTTDFMLNLTGRPNVWGACGPDQIGDEIPNQPKGYVPHHLPGANTQIEEFLTGHDVPADAARGGALTTYPEYRLALERGEAAAARRTLRARPGGGGDPVRDEPDRPGEIDVLPVQGNVWLLAGAGGNVTVQVADDGILVVDTGLGEMSGEALAALRTISDKPIRFVVNTHVHADHTGGNATLAQAGAKIAEGLFVGGQAAAGAAIVAHERVLWSLSADGDQPGALPPAGWPSIAYTTGPKDLFVNGEAVQLLHQPAAHTDGDSIVFFRRSDVISTGDIFVTTSYPVIDRARGGSLNGIIDALNQIIDLAVPRDWQEGGTMVVPGHGRLGDEADVVEYRDMVTIIRDRIQNLIERGLTLEQVQAARPTFDYDGRYGSTTGPWTTEMFVETAYRDLSGN